MSQGYGSFDQQHGADGLGSDGAGRSGQLDRVLADLLGRAPEVEAAAVVSFDGLPMASALPPGMDEDRVAAMSAALLSLGERAAQGLGRGDLSQVYVEGQSGTVFLVSADDEAVLVAVGARGAKVGLVLFEVRQAAERVAQVLRVVAEPVLEVVPEPVAAVASEPEPVAQPDPQPQDAQPVRTVTEVPQVSVPVAERPAMAPMNELPPTPAPVESLPPVPVPVAEAATEPREVSANGRSSASGGSNGQSNGSWPMFPPANPDGSSWS